MAYSSTDNSVVLTFAAAIPEGNYRLDIGQSGGDDDATTNALVVGSLFDENPFTHNSYLGDKASSSADLTDKDLYKVTLRAGAMLTVTATPGATGLVLATRLLDAGGAFVASLTSPFTVPATPAFSEYFIEVAGAAGNTGFGAYSIVASVAGSPLVSNPLLEDVNTTIGDATQVGTLGAAGITIKSQIEPQTIPLPPLPGSEDEPAHRQIQRETHIGATGTTPTVPQATQVRLYYFPNTLGTDTSGNPYDNKITETEKQIVRGIYEIYAQKSGFEFVETSSTTPGSPGTMIGKGDLRALDPTIGPNSGVAGLGGSGAVVLNNSLYTQSTRFFGDGFTETMFHELGHSLGLSHSYDLPSVQGAALPNDVRPGDHDIVHLQRIVPPNSTDIDMYRFDLTESGRFTAETIAERLTAPDVTSLLNTALTLYREIAGGDIELVARNDQYFGADSFLDLQLEPGTYFVGVTSTGNTQYDPRVPDSGFGGSTDGEYKLKLAFEADRDGSLRDSRGTPVDGDADSAPGGVHSFWFQSSDQSTSIYVDKLNDTTAGVVDGTGALSDPYDTIDFALLQAGNRIVVPTTATKANLTGQSFVVDDGVNPAVTFTFDSGIALLATDSPIDIATKIRTAITAAFPGPPTVTVGGTGRVVQLSGIDNLDVSGSTVLINTPNLVHIVGNGGADRNIDTLVDNRPYLIGEDVGGNALADGAEFLVPQGVNVMLHAGALLKMKVANLDAGTSADINRSHSSIQVLGTPKNAVFLRSFHNDTVGGNSDGVGPLPTSGDFGGIVFRADSDLEASGIFLNYVNHLDINNGGGKVFVGADELVFTPIHIIDARPTVSFNRITSSNFAAVSASPDSFDDSLGRIGPDVYGNFLEGNTIDGLFIRVQTPLGSNLNKLTVSGRLDDTDIAHVLSENLIIAGAQAVRSNSPAECGSPDPPGDC